KWRRFKRKFSKFSVGNEAINGEPGCVSARRGRKRQNMRRITIAFGIGALLFATGCPPFQKKSAPDLRSQVSPTTPTAPELVASVSDNARKVQSVGVRYLDIDCAQGAQSVGLRGWMYCQKPKSFRMTAELAGNSEVDMGSNEQEFWY